MQTTKQNFAKQTRRTVVSSIYEDATLATSKGWFDEALRVLNVKGGPRWPDEFGKAIDKWFKRNDLKQIPTLSLFTGAGGLDIGFHDSGFHSQEMVEIEKRFVDTLVENTNKGKCFFGANAKCIDIREYNPSKEINVDFIIGGPP